MSMTKPSDDSFCPYQAAVSNSNVTTITVSNTLRDVATILPFQESRYKDGGAHWYRSSAVLLRYHRLSSVLFTFLEKFLTTLLITNRNWTRVGPVVSRTIGLK